MNSFQKDKSRQSVPLSIKRKNQKDLISCKKLKTNFSKIKQLYSGIEPQSKKTNDDDDEPVLLKDTRFVEKSSEGIENNFNSVRISNSIYSHKGVGGLNMGVLMQPNGHTNNRSCDPAISKSPVPNNNFVIGSSHTIFPANGISSIGNSFSSTGPFIQNTPMVIPGQEIQYEHGRFQPVINSVFTTNNEDFDSNKVLLSDNPQVDKSFAISSSDIYIGKGYPFFTYEYKCFTCHVSFFQAKDLTVHHKSPIHYRNSLNTKSNPESVQSTNKPKKTIETNRNLSNVSRYDESTNGCIRLGNKHLSKESHTYVPLNLLKKKVILYGNVKVQCRECNKKKKKKGENSDNAIYKLKPGETEKELPLIFLPYQIKIKTVNGAEKIVVMYLPQVEDASNKSITNCQEIMPENAYVGEVIQPVKDHQTVRFNQSWLDPCDEVSIDRVVETDNTKRTASSKVASTIVDNQSSKTAPAEIIKRAACSKVASPIVGNQSSKTAPAEIIKRAACFKVSSPIVGNQLSKTAPVGTSPKPTSLSPENLSHANNSKSPSYLSKKKEGKESSNVESFMKKLGLTTTADAVVDTPAPSNPLTISSLGSSPMVSIPTSSNAEIVQCQKEQTKNTPKEQRNPTEDENGKSKETASFNIVSQGTLTEEETTSLNSYIDSLLSRNVTLTGVTNSSTYGKKQSKKFMTEIPKDSLYSVNQSIDSVTKVPSNDSVLVTNPCPGVPNSVKIQPTEFKMLKIPVLRLKKIDSMKEEKDDLLDNSGLENLKVEIPDSSDRTPPSVKDSNSHRSQPNTSPPSLNTSNDHNSGTSSCKFVQASNLKDSEKTSKCLSKIPFIQLKRLEETICKKQLATGFTNARHSKPVGESLKNRLRSSRCNPTTGNLEALKGPSILPLEKDPFNDFFSAVEKFGSTLPTDFKSNSSSSFQLDVANPSKLISIKSAYKLVAITSKIDVTDFEKSRKSVKNVSSQPVSIPDTDLTRLNYESDSDTSTTIECSPKSITQISNLSNPFNSKTNMNVSFGSSYNVLENEHDEVIPKTNKSKSTSILAPLKSYRKRRPKSVSEEETAKSQLVQDTENISGDEQNLNSELLDGAAKVPLTTDADELVCQTKVPPSCVPLTTDADELVCLTKVPPSCVPVNVEQVPVPTCALSNCSIEIPIDSIDGYIDSEEEEDVYCYQSNSEDDLRMEDDDVVSETPDSPEFKNKNDNHASESSDIEGHLGGLVSTRNKIKSYIHLLYQKDKPEPTNNSFVGEEDAGNHAEEHRLPSKAIPCKAEIVKSEVDDKEKNQKEINNKGTILKIKSKYLGQSIIRCKKLKEDLTDVTGTSVSSPSNKN